MKIAELDVADKKPGQEGRFNLIMGIQDNRWV